MADRSETMRTVMRYLVYPVQGVLIVGALCLCRMLPITWAAGFGAWLFRLVGPRLKANKIARRNLKRAFPEKSDAEVERILRGVWDNLGRGAGEWSQVDMIPTTGPDSRVEVIGEEHLIAARDGEGSYIIFAGHMGNWEVASLVAAHRDTPLANIYRPAANPWVERLFLKVRGRFCSELLPKGRGGAKRMLGVLREGKPLGLLVDQKLNEGLPIPFFGRDAMTASAPAEMALRLRCPLIPVRLERLPGSRFRVEIFPPMELPDTGDKKADVVTILTRMNVMLEDWIRQNPDQWFWVHRRWPD